MLLVLVAAVGLSSVLDRLGAAAAAHAPGLLRILQREPYQDALVLGCFGLAVAVLIWLVSAWSLAPLSRASREAAQVGPDRPGLRISAAMLPAEMRPMVGAVNGALDRLEIAYATERRFTADAAHELRTPLAVLTLRLQQARARDRPSCDLPDWAAIDADLRHMGRLVAQLLDLARKQAATRADGVEPVPVNLSRIAREAAATILPMAEAAGRNLVTDLPEMLAARGCADDLRDMVMNLLENALVHGRGRIRLSGQAGHGRSVLDVEDDGPGVPDDLRDAVFDRFRKVEPGSPGSGLGLAIVREVARTHGGRVVFESGQGCRVRVDLPDGN